MLAGVLFSALVTVVRLGLGFEATGIFANRNHQALFLSTAFPLINAWLSQGEARPSTFVRHWIAACASAFVLVVVPLTGSRAGAFLSVLSLALSIGVFFRFWRPWIAGNRALILRAAVAIVALMVTFVLSGRATSISRLLDGSGEPEQRFQLLPVVLHQAMAMMPVGSGFGAFDEVFRSVEPDWALHQTYFNHAHNDLAEMFLTGGVAGLLLVLGVLLLWFRGIWRVFRSEKPLQARSATWAGAIIMLLIFLASLVDYPLRTSLIGAQFIIAAAWLLDPPDDGKRSIWSAGSHFTRRKRSSNR
ncbi:MAG: O-antigen ligase family protein [Novosphingobium sp.]